MMTSSRNGLKEKKRIVVKVGTSSLSFQNGKVNYTKLLTNNNEKSPGL